MGGGSAPRASSKDLRERLVASRREEQLSEARLAARFRVSTGTVLYWLQRVEATSSVAPKPYAGGREPTVDAAGAVLLRSPVGEQNDRTFERLATHYAARTGVRPSRAALARRLIQLELA